MKLLLVVLSVLITFTTGFNIPEFSNIYNRTHGLPEERATIYTSFITKVDHFRPQNSAYASFFYAHRDEYFQEGGPIFLYISDTQGNEFSSLHSGLIHDLAQEFNGLLVTTDLRYFWNNDAIRETFSFEDMTYLTVDQLLADISHLIVNIKRTFNADDSKVILHGVGIGGTLATWARQKYPHLVNGVWSSSGIFVASDFTSDPYLRLSNVIDTYGSSQCSTNVRNAFDIMENLVQSNDGERLQQALRLCSSFNTTSDLNIAMLFEQQIEFIWQFFNNFQQYGVDLLCEFMEESGTDTLQLFGNWIYHYFGLTCWDFSYEDRIALIAYEGLNQSTSVIRVRQWYHLTCTQLGNHKITAWGGTMFGRHVTEAYHYYACRDVLGEHYDFANLPDEISRLYIEYGGKNPAVSHVIFTNGVNDPWYNYGITEYNEPDSYVFNIEGVFRGADMKRFPVEPHLNVLDVLDRIEDILREWLSPEIIPN